MVALSRITFVGNVAYAYHNDGSVVQCVPTVDNQWVAPGDTDTDTDTGGGGGGGGIAITKEMVEAAVNSVGGSLSAMVGTSQEIANAFNEAIADTYPGILSDKKRAACLAGECAQETDWFKTTTEYTAGGNTYSPYDGRGFIQLTWRDNYAGFGRWMKSLGKLSDPDYFVDNPSRLADLKWAAYTAIYYFTQVKWDGKNLFEFCSDSSSPWSDISRAINRGNPYATSPAYGESERTTAINAVLGVTPDPDPPSTGGGSAQVVVDWMIDHIGAFRYSQDLQKRRDPITYGESDCSGTINYAYRTLLNIHVGWWTGSHSDGMQQYGRSIIPKTSAPVDESKLVPGDLVFFNWDGDSRDFDHVDMYKGGNEVIGHGGPGMGPTIKPLASRCAYAYNYHVRRYL